MKAAQALLWGDGTQAHQSRWRTALMSAGFPLPLVTPDEVNDASQVQVAVVANPAGLAWHAWPQLQFVQSLWAGVDRLMDGAGPPAHVPLARMVDPAMNQAMAQTALWAVLTIHRDFWVYQAQQKQALWKVWPQRRAQDVRVTVLGAGQMGMATAKCLSQLGYAVTTWRRQAPATSGVDAAAHHAMAANEQHMGWSERAGNDDLPACLKHTDILINLLPLTADTRGFLNAERLAMLPRGAAIVNLARGAHVQDQALLDALDSGHLAHAVLDVFNHEPLAADHPYWWHPLVTVLPHVAAQTDERTAASVVVDNVKRWLRGETPHHLVNRQLGY